MTILLLTFGFCILSALIPVLNAEAYLAAVAITAGHVDIVWLAAIAGLGQLVGKILWYEVGRRSMHLGWMRRQMAKPKWRKQYVKWSGRVQGRPWFSATVLFASALFGFPPLAVTAVLAGQLRMSFPVFAVTCFVGRSIRFWAVLAGVSLIELG